MRRGFLGIRRASVTLTACAALIVGLPALARAENVRVKDLAHVQGVRNNVVQGLGLVVGLGGSGDGDKLLTQSRFANLLRNALDTEIPAAEIKAKNVAVVMVTADLPAFAREGTRLDLRVASAGEAKSLNGGLLLLTPLAGPDGIVYATASGPLLGSPNEPTFTVASIPGGGIVETELVSSIIQNNKFRLILAQADFSTAVSMATAINGDPRLRPDAPLGGAEAVERLAKALDGRTIEVTVPISFADDPLTFLAIVEQVIVPVVDLQGTVVIDTRALTLVIAGPVTVSAVTVESGRVELAIEPPPGTPEPPELRADRARALSEARERVHFPAGRSLRDLVMALKRLRVPAEEIISIVRSIDRAGALRGRLVLE